MIPFALLVVKQHLNLPHLAYKQTDLSLPPSPIPLSPPPGGIRERSMLLYTYRQRKGGSGDGKMESHEQTSRLI